MAAMPEEDTTDRTASTITGTASKEARTLTSHQASAVATAAMDRAATTADPNATRAVGQATCPETAHAKAETDSRVTYGWAATPPLITKNENEPLSPRGITAAVIDHS